MVAAMVASEPALTAITSERTAASCTCALFQADSNHWKEMPSHTASDDPALNANTTSVAIGRYSRKKQIIAIVVKPGCRRTLKGAAMARPRPRRVADIEQQRHHDDDHQGDRDRGAQRPVAALAEL